MQPTGKGAASQQDSMYDATGALKIKTLGGGMAGGAAVNSRSYINHLFINIEKNPFQQRRGTQGEDGGSDDQASGPHQT
jgi:hypothetical protein